MKILLVTPYISSVWDSGKYVMKALFELRHNLTLWDPYVSINPPSQDYELAFVLKGLNVKIEKLKRPRVNLYPDDITNFPREEGFKEKLDAFINKFDYFFTTNISDRGIWIPGCCDRDIHKPYEIEQPFDVVFVGTAHSKERAEFIMNFAKKFKGKVAVFGNGWDDYPIKTNPPRYFDEFCWVMSASKIALNIHGDMFGVGLNRKVHEIAGCGSAMLLTDNVDGLEETYPMAPKFNSLEECLELTEYYLNNLRERRKLVKEMQKQAYEKFTYKHQVAKILKIVEEKLL